MSEIINIEDVDIGYGKKLIIQNINLKINKGDYVYINGENGSGKSSFLKLLYMKILPKKGTYKLFNKKIVKEEKVYIQQSRKRLGVILQKNYLIPYLTVEQNIQISSLIQKESKNISNSRITEIINWVGLENKVESKIMYLSDGEKQKVIFARSILSNPEILIADEPMNCLDMKTKEKFFFLLNTINKLGTTVIITERDNFSIKNERHIKVLIKNKRLIKE